jgi:hypothetical protein
MGLLSHAAALGLGYVLGRPGRRPRLDRLRRQAVELTRHPAVKRLREHGWDVLGDQLLAARNLATRRSRRADVAQAMLGDSAGPTGPAETGTAPRNRP